MSYPVNRVGGEMLKSSNTSGPVIIVSKDCTHLDEEKRNFPVVNDGQMVSPTPVSQL